MNTNNVIKIVTAGIVLGGMTFIAHLDNPANYLPALSAAASYVAVGGLVAIAACEYPKYRRMLGFGRR
jgi:hypothetical protein